MRTRGWVLAVLAIGLWPALALADHEYNFARISYVEGGFYLQRAENYNTGEVGVNTPVGSGDSLWTEVGGRLEIEFEAGNYVRLDENSRVDVRSIEGADVIGLQGGSIYVDLRSPVSFRVDTPFASVVCRDAGVYRIDMGAAGGMQITVIEGFAEVENSAGSVSVGAGYQTVVSAGRVPAYPTRSFGGRHDSFDDFQNARSGSVAYGEGEPSYLPSQIGGYEYELSSYGRWVYVSPYGRVWVPGGVAADWRPYYHGYWDYVPRCGWSWVSYEPWGWAPYHYGRWDFVIGVGWFWIPGTTWGPAWVSWSTWGGYLGWCPLNWYNRPVVIVNNYYGNWWGDNWVSNPDPRSWTFIPKETIGTRDIRRVAVGENVVRGISKITVSRDPLTIAPKTGVVRTPAKGGSVISARDSTGSGGTVRRIDGGGSVTASPNPGTYGRTSTGGKGGSSVSGGSSGGIIHREGPNPTYSGGKGGSSVSGSGGVIRRESPNPVYHGTEPKGGSSVKGGSSTTVQPRGTDSGKSGSGGTVDRNIYYHSPSTKGGGNSISSGRGDDSSRAPVVKGGSGSGDGTIYYHAPAPVIRGGGDSRSSDSSGGSVRGYYGGGYGSSNKTTIVRDPEERQPGDAPYVIQGGGDSQGDAFWGKVYDQFRSSSRAPQQSAPEGRSSYGQSSPKGGSSTSGHYSAPPTMRSAPPSRSYGSSSSSKGGGNQVRKKD